MELAKVAPPAPAPARLDPVAAPIATELPAYKAVAAVSSDVGMEGSAPTTARALAEGAAERRVVVDPGTRELVTMTIDAATRDVVAQTPDPTQLGLRAYIDGLARRQEAVAQAHAAHVLPALVV